jgi:methylaspartate mutase sigma subunit
MTGPTATVPAQLAPEGADTVTTDSAAAEYDGTPGLTVVLSSVSSDSHTWNLVYLQLYMEEQGHRVINLGACVPDDLLIDECVRTRPDLVVISTVNGHGSIDGSRLIARIRSVPELADTPVAIGGMLGINGPDGQRSKALLLAAGYTAVFDSGARMPAFRSFLTRLAAGVAA